MSGRRRRARGRNINGILLLDKPSGMSSNAALQKVKWLFKGAKAGHTGSLDPLATGLLPICFGEATKFSQFLLESDKRYQATAKLGVRTETGDSEGEIVSERPVPELSNLALEDVLNHFRGEIEQVPSMYSALKHEGQPLYKLARQGIEVERKARKITVYELQLLTLEADSFSINVKCSKGTYIRSLVEDIGEELGCGAHVTALRRLEAGPYDGNQMVTLDMLQQCFEESGSEGLDHFLLPLDTSVKDWPAVELTNNTAYYLQQGQPVQVSQGPSDGWVSLYQLSKEGDSKDFIGVGEILDDGRVAPRRLISQQL